MQSTLIRSHLSVVSPSGHINASNAPLFRQELFNILTARQQTALLVDMSNVEMLDSAGLMVLVSALNQAQSANQRFALCNVPSSIRIILELTQLDRAFEIFADRTAFEAVVA